MGISRAAQSLRSQAPSRDVAADAIGTNTDPDAAFNRGWRAAGGLVIELGLFLCSYAPLFTILAIRFRPWWLVGVCIGLAALGVVAGLAIVHQFRRVAPTQWRLVAAEDRGEEVAGYVASYLLPFLTVAEPSVRDLIAYALFITIVAVVYVRSGLVRVNPTLYLFGWRLHAVQIGDRGWIGYVLSRGRLHAGDRLRGVRLTDRLFVSY